MGRLTDELAGGVSEPQSTIVADLVDVRYCVSELGAVVSDSLATQLVGAGQFRVQERRLLMRILEEQNLKMSDLFDPATAAEVGALAGVQTIVLGTMTRIGDSVRVNLRLIQIETGEAITATNATLSLPEDMRGMADNWLTCGDTAIGGANTSAVAALPGAGGGYGQGLLFEYFNVAEYHGTLPNLRGKIPLQTDVRATTVRKWLFERAEGVKRDWYGVRVTREFQITTPGTYRFRWRVDDEGTATVGAETMTTHFGREEFQT